MVNEIDRLHVELPDKEYHDRLWVYRYHICAAEHYLLTGDTLPWANGGANAFFAEQAYNNFVNHESTKDNEKMTSSELENEISKIHNSVDRGKFNEMVLKFMAFIAITALAGNAFFFRNLIANVENLSKSVNILSTTVEIHKSYKDEISRLSDKILLIDSWKDNRDSIIRVPLERNIIALEEIKRRLDKIEHRLENISNK
jgi:CRISPR/Cas system-associated exonuclease Cas4 (RecB family)